MSKNILSFPIFLSEKCRSSRVDKKSIHWKLLAWLDFWEYKIEPEQEDEIRLYQK